VDPAAVGEDDESGAAKGGGVMSLGRLIGAEWSVGVTVGSSTTCGAAATRGGDSGSAASVGAGEGVAAPFVNVSLRIADADGHVKTQALHLTVTEFRELERSLGDVSEVMDRM
jgi:hypothetical protein